MYSVTQRIQNVKQPYGGYLPIKDFEIINLYSERELLDGESLTPALAGLAVDYLTRTMSGTPVDEAFQVSLTGASMIGESKNAVKLSKTISGLDDTSIEAACRLVGYDCVFRSGKHTYKDVKLMNVSSVDITNIKEMVQRSLNFFKDYGPVVSDGLTFEGGYTNLVSSGDGDFLTFDTLWDFKVSVNKPTSKHTLQLLMYYIMGMHSTHSSLYKQLKYLAIYNPRLNTIYRYPISDIPKEVMDVVADDVIGYRTKINASEKNVLLSVKDVAARYGVGENKIRNDCFSLGMPHSKDGNKYVINEMELIEWEVQQVYIPVGRNQKKLLPGYLAFVGMLKERLKQAKQEGDKEKTKELKELLKALEKRNPNYRAGDGVVYFALAVAVLLLLYVLKLTLM